MHLHVLQLKSSATDLFWARQTRDSTLAPHVVPEKATEKPKKRKLGVDTNEAEADRDVKFPREARTKRRETHRQAKAHKAVCLGAALSSPKEALGLFPSSTHYQAFN